jgi:hypothetical protein
VAVLLVRGCCLWWWRSCFNFLILYLLSFTVFFCVVMFLLFFIPSFTLIFVRWILINCIVVKFWK